MMERMARNLANWLISVFEEENNPFYIISNPDADGMSSAAIITKLLETCKITPVVEFANSLQIHEVVKRLMESEESSEGVWIFTDTGISSTSFFERIKKKVIIDHHHEEKKLKALPRIKSERVWGVLVSPEVLGITKEDCSSSFLAYLIARNLIESDEMAILAILGALGDGLVKKEFVLPLRVRALADKLAEKGKITIKKDLIIPGKETLSLAKLLIDTNALLSMGFEDAALRDKVCGVMKWKQKDLESLKWFELEPKEKRKILSCIAKERLRMGQEPDRVLEMVGEVYLINAQRPGIHLHDCADFSKLLNECGEKAPGLGYNLCLNQTEENYRNIMRALYPR